MQCLQFTLQFSNTCCFTSASGARSRFFESFLVFSHSECVSLSKMTEMGVSDLRRHTKCEELVVLQDRFENHCIREIILTLFPNVCFFGDTLNDLGSFVTIFVGREQIHKQTSGISGSLFQVGHTQQESTHKHL